MQKLVSTIVATGALAAILVVSGTINVNGAVHARESVATTAAIVDEPVALEETSEPAQSTAAIELTSLDTRVLNERWGLEHIGVAAAWGSAGSLSPVLVAVIDTGIDPQVSYMDRVKAGIDFTGSGSVSDEHGHGTHMAGTIAAIAPNATFVNLKVADKRGRCESHIVAKAIRWAADRGALVINVSLEVEPTPALQSAVEHAWNKGAVVIAAAGNSGSTSPAYPAAYDEAIAVAGTNPSDGLAVLSNHGEWVDIAAPGLKIYSELPGGTYGLETGTSPAASHVSGVAALAFGTAIDTNGNGYTNDEVRDALESSADSLSISGIGYGLVDACGTLDTLS